MFEKVLVCLDGSELAEQILPYVSEPCLKYKSRIILTQVITTSITIPPPETVHSPEITRAIGRKPFPVSDMIGDTTLTVEPKVEIQLEEIEKEQADARAYLDKLARSLRRKGQSVKTVALQGEPGEEILNYSAKEKVTLIALTSRGMSGRKNRSIGRVAQFILKEADLPVLLVKPK